MGKQQKDADPDMGIAEIFREAMKTFGWIQAAKHLAALGKILPILGPNNRGRRQPTNDRLSLIDESDNSLNDAE